MKRKKKAPRKKASPNNENKGFAYIEDLKKQLGRPPSLVESDLLCSQIKKLSAMQCTREEAAAFFGVSQPTFRKFLAENPASADAWVQGREYGRLSLRRMQWQTAMNGNVRMQIWLGIQMLGQTNRLDARHTEIEDAQAKAITQDMTAEQAASAWADVLHDRPQ